MSRISRPLGGVLLCRHTQTSWAAFLIASGHRQFHTLDCRKIDVAAPTIVRALSAHSGIVLDDAFRQRELGFSLRLARPDAAV